MSGPSDPTSAAEASRLSEIRGKVEYKISRMNPDRVNASNLSVMRTKLGDIQELSQQFGLGMIAFLKAHPSLEEPLKLQYNSDLSNFHNSVDDHEDEVTFNVYSVKFVNSCACPLPTSLIIPT